MRTFIFYTTEGYTQNKNDENIENCQILDWQTGKDENDAFKKFKKDNQNINFREICCQELVSFQVYNFSLS